ncbi:MAG: RNA polymerase-binding protein DksA [Ramlibacter sp.]
MPAHKAAVPVKAAAKKAAPASKAKPVAKPPAAKTAAAKTKAGASKVPSTNSQAQPRAMPPRPDAATLTAEPARATKPSARLAQITVPSMAQSVASTAAKASYIQTMSPSVLTPPPLVAIKKDPKLANNWKSKSVEQLTDAEVLAMPDTEYMNEKQMGFFRLKLAQLKQDILNNAGETTEHLREDTVIVPDPADRATIEEEHALELRTRDRERKLLKKIEQSIARIDAGDYGYCDETGEPIGVGRLLARPTATLSLEAQQRRELKQKMFGD